MSNPNNRCAWHGIPRQEIDWHPTIVAEHCIGCDLCMVGCTTCTTKHTRDAIAFPSTGHIHQLIRERKVLHQAKDMLKAALEKMDVSRCVSEL